MNSGTTHDSPSGADRPAADGRPAGGSAMRRPVMDPLFLADEPAAAPARRRWVPAAARWARWAARALLSSPLARRRRVAAAADGRDGGGGRGARLARAAGYRLVFAPALVALVAATLVFSGTRPRPAAAAAPPAGEPGLSNVYFDPVEVAADDGVRSAGWVVPVVDARRVLLHRDRLLRQRHPAVVLAHDFGRSPDDLLPLVGPLHDDGIVVLAVGLRGAGTPSPAAQTFGLNEARDVLAAVGLLRDRPFVDPRRVAVVGVGTGANAAVLAAARDPAVAALVLADPVTDPAAAAAARLGPDRAGLRWLQPPTRWAFEIGFQQHLDDVRPDEHAAALAGRPVLRLAGATAPDGRPTAATVEKVRAFCRENLKPWERE